AKGEQSVKVIKVQTASQIWASPCPEGLNVIVDELGSISCYQGRPSDPLDKKMGTYPILGGYCGTLCPNNQLFIAHGANVKVVEIPTMVRVNEWTIPFVCSTVTSRLSSSRTSITTVEVVIVKNSFDNLLHFIVLDGRNGQTLRTCIQRDK